MLAMVCGMPLSYFEDVIRNKDNSGDLPNLAADPGNFPDGATAVSSPVPENSGQSPPSKCTLPIGGTEDPLQMSYYHRADYLPNAGGKFVHYNKYENEIHKQSYKDVPKDDWNRLEVEFLPARYEGNTKCSNAYIKTRVNGKPLFQGEIKSGSRPARHNVNQDPEPAGNADPNGKVLRLLAHWGSKVYYHNAVIKIAK